MQKIYTKKFRSIKDQIQLLKDRGLNFKDEEMAKDLLLQKNYFDIINGFETLLLIDSKTQNKQYCSDTYFEYFNELYKFDKLFAFIVFKTIDLFENRLKSSIAYRFCESVFVSNPNTNPACYLNPIMYHNPYSVHNRLNTLLPGRITQQFVSELNNVIDNFVNKEVVRIQNKITSLNGSSIDYISKKARTRLYRSIGNLNRAISKTNEAIRAANTSIGATPTPQGNGIRVQLITQFATTLTTSLTKVTPDPTVDPSEVEAKIISFLKKIEEYSLRVDKVCCQVAANNNINIHTLPHEELNGFIVHNLFKTNHKLGREKNLNYIEFAKKKYSYLNKYEVPPFWVIIKTLELGSVKKLMYGLKNDILDNVLIDMGLTISDRHILFNSISIITDLRNHCAHFGLINRFRTKPSTKINAGLIQKLGLTTKSNGNTHYEIRLYDTLKILAQFASLSEVGSLFKEYFMSNDCPVNPKIVKKLLDRMGNDNLSKWCGF